MVWHAIFQGDFEPDEVEAYRDLLQNLRSLQNRVASMQMDRATVEKLSADLAAWGDQLAPLETDEWHQANGRMLELPVRGHAMLPELVVTQREADHVVGTVRFGRWFLGGAGAAHGGAVALIMDEILGIQSGLAGGGMTRTAYLKTDYRALTPIDEDLDVTARVVKVEGRKIFVHGEVRYKGALCAEAEGLFLKLDAGSPGKKPVPAE